MFHSFFEDLIQLFGVNDDMKKKLTLCQEISIHVLYYNVVWLAGCMIVVLGIIVAYLFESVQLL